MAGSVVQFKETESSLVFAKLGVIVDELASNCRQFVLCQSRWLLCEQLSAAMEGGFH
eukprot:m.22727 g.22727  ORF g.22727 m.22727 type:complete len:57 (-) comp5851_c0_seq1:2500-2670(-)